jgi:hypothetical protein
MSKARDRKIHIWDRPENVKKFIRGFFILCGLMLALDFIPFQHSSFGEHFDDANHNHQFDPGEHYDDHNGNGQYDPPQFEGETWFGFYSFYGLVSCVVLVLVATELRKILMREENYYDR